MGAGKSLVGDLVAQKLGWEMIDVDVAITARNGLTVREIWEHGGEEAYRHLESDVVLQALRRSEPVVIAAPAGIVLDPAVRTALSDGDVIWLRADPAVLAGRVRPGDHRPLLGDDPLLVLATMNADRASLYLDLADFVIDTDHVDGGAVAALVIDFLQIHTLPSPTE